jgi:hypothetical protein
MIPGGRRRHVRTLRAWRGDPGLAPRNEASSSCVLAKIDQRGLMASASHRGDEDGNHAQAYPWECESAAYEQRKMAAVAAILPRARYRSAFEAGAAIGGLTEVLALRCDELLWNDLTPSSCGGQARPVPGGGPRPRDSALSDQWPSWNLDLVVLNEVAARLDDDDLDTLVDCLLRSTLRGAHVVEVRARNRAECPLKPDGVSSPIAESQRFVALAHYREDEFLLDVWERW